MNPFAPVTTTLAESSFDSVLSSIFEELWRYYCLDIIGLGRFFVEDTWDLRGHADAYAAVGEAGFLAVSRIENVSAVDYYECGEEFFEAV